MHAYLGREGNCGWEGNGKIRRKGVGGEGREGGKGGKRGKGEGREGREKYGNV